MKGLGKATICIVFVTLVGALEWFAVPVARAQEGDPSDVWLRAYMVMREGEAKEEEKRDLEALSKYREAQRLFDFLARTHPNWKSNMITFRRKALLDKIEEVHNRLKGNDPAGEQEFRAQNPGVVASAPIPSRPGGITVAPNVEAAPQGTGLVPPTTPPPSAPGIVSAPVESISKEFRNLQDQLDRLTGANQRLVAERDQREQVVSGLEKQLEQSRQVEKQLRDQLTKTLDDLKTAQNAGGERQRQLEEQLKLATKDLREANAQSAGILKELETAKQEVAELTKQKNALLASREGEMERTAQLTSQLEQAAGDRDKARAERDAAKELIAKLQAQMQGGDPALKAPNEELIAELKKSQETISSLHTKVQELEQEKAGLQQTNQQLLARQDQLTKERDLLRKERDEMAILLNASDQIQGDVKDIVAANGAWRKQLEEANKRTLELQQKEGNYQAEINQLRGQISVMKEERDVLRAENTRYQETVTQLNGKLEKMLADLNQKTKALEELAAGRVGAGDTVVAADGKTYTRDELAVMAGAKEENELLRGFIREQLVRQARAHTARQLVLQELEKMDFQSELLLTSLDDMVGQQINISEEEKKLFKGREEMQLIEVVTNGANDKPFASVKTSPQAKEARQKHITQLAKAANYDFTRKAYDKARQGYEQILAMEPGNVFALANMGLIFTQQGDPAKAKDYLQKALSQDQTHAPTYYYLGLLHFKQGEYDEAMDAFGKCLTHERKNANAHFYIGLLATEKGWVPRAESEFQQAIELEPQHVNAHFNLAVLYARYKPDKDLAQKHYQAARKLGAAIDPAIEDFVASR